MFNEIKEKIQNAKRILITAHKNPDGDAIGSGLALMLALNALNSDKEIIIRFVIDDKIPKYLKFLNHSFLIEEKSNVDTKYKFDLIIALDSANIERIGRVAEFIDETNTVINIDHHISNTKYGNINFIGSEYSSTSEIIYELIQFLNIKIDLDIAEAIYTGIVNDTGNFAYSNVTEKTFFIAYELKKIGVDNSKINNILFKNKSLKQMKLFGKLFTEFVFVKEKKLIYYFLSYNDMKSDKLTKDDTEGLVDFLRDFEEADFSLFLREEENGSVKGSIRSKNGDSNHLASLFNGGGHKKAAGFTSSLSSTEVIDIIMKNIIN